MKKTYCSLMIILSIACLIVCMPSMSHMERSRSICRETVRVKQIRPIKIWRR